MSGEAYEVASGASELPPEDAHRFSSETKKRSGSGSIRAILWIVGALVAAVGVGGYFAKDALQSYRDQQAQRQKDKKHAQTTQDVRKGKTFASEAVPAGSAASEALPKNFGQKDVPPGLDAPIPLTASQGQRQGHGGVGPVASTAATGQSARPRSTMFVSDREQSEVVLSSSAGTPSTALPTPPYLANAQASSAQLGAAPTAAASTPAQSTAAGLVTVQDVARAQRGRATSLTSTGQTSAARLGDRSMVLARGTYVPCVLETDLNSNVPGPSSCVVTENIYSDDGRTVLIDKGAKVQGEYKATLKQGDARLEVIWKRIRTPDGVAIDVESPAGDEHGAVGVAGEIDNHWMQRIGAAFLLSMVQDVVAARAAKQQNSNTTVNTGNTTKSMAEKVLDATINIPPTLFKNRGERLLILVNRDLWFDGVYVLEGARP